MVQPVLKQDGIPDGALRYAGQLGAAISAHPALTAAADHSASSLARRFAPASARPRSAGADPTVLPRRDAAPARWSWRHRRAMFLASALAIATAAIAGGVALRGNSDSVGLDTALAGTGHDARRTPRTHASASLLIPVDPPSGAPSDTAGGQNKARVDSPSASEPSAGFVIRSGESDRIEGLMAHGQKMIDVGYLAGARAYYRRAAEAGSGEAALAAGATYDPDIVARLGVQGIKPDRAEAAKWYASAAGLGIANRDKALRTLTDRWGAGPAIANASGTTTSIAMRPAVSPPLRKPGAAAAPEYAAEDAPKQQHLASNETSAPGTVRPQLLASEGGEEPAPGPLSRLVKAAAGLSAQEEWMEVASPVNIRRGPSSSSGTDKVVPRGTKFRVVGREGNWIHVANPKTRREGYIYSRFLKTSSAP